MTAQPRHTPGPWKVTGGPRIWDVRASRQNGAEPHIASVSNIGLTEDRALANARLIVASPTLLEALRALATEREIEDDVEPCWCGIYTIGRHTPKCANARAAIRLAEGEE